MGLLNNYMESSVKELLAEKAKGKKCEEDEKVFALPGVGLLNNMRFYLCQI